MKLFARVSPFLQKETTVTMTKLKAVKSVKNTNSQVAKLDRNSLSGSDSEHSKDPVPTVCSVNKSQVRAGVDAFLEYLKKKDEDKVELFDEEEAIFLQITAIKVPKCPSRQLRLSLCHSLATDSSEICLIVPDVGKPKEVILQ